MTRVLTYGMLAACVLAVLGIAAPQQPVFRGRGDAVRVFVTVTDRDGRLVTNLTRDNFEIRDEGRPQPITVFDKSPQPIRLIVMLDVSVWRAIDDALDAFGEESEERRVILVLSDGKDSGRIDVRQGYVSQGEVIDRARDDDVMVYGIGLRSRPPVTWPGHAMTFDSWSNCA